MDTIFQKINKKVFVKVGDVLGNDVVRASKEFGDDKNIDTQLLIGFLMAFITIQFCDGKITLREVKEAEE
jgi:hypothetical protein